LELPSRSEILGNLSEFKKAVVISLIFLVFSFVYSFIGFLHVEPAVHVHEYSPSKLAIEIAGHFTFGFLAGLLMFDVILALLVGASAVLIDSDHILAALDYNVSGRPDHSFLFSSISVLVFVLAARKLNVTDRVFYKIMFIAPVVILSHISYDVFAASSQGASSFPLLVPFDFSGYYLSPPFWAILEVAAGLLSFLAYWTSRRLARRVVGKEERKRSKKVPETIVARKRLEDTVIS
jgi:hypothetical protein